MPAEKKYWFPSKSYGFGWGAPSTWQGWAVLIGYSVLLGLGIFIVPPEKVPAYFFTYVGMLTVVLFFIFWKKGEPLRWRWGK